MNDNPAETSILFAKIVDESGICQKLFNEIYEFFGKLSNYTFIYYNS